MLSVVFRLKNLTDKDRVTERRVSSSEFVDFLQKYLTNEISEHLGQTITRYTKIGSGYHIKQLLDY
jgi:hypothetical protein